MEGQACMRAGCFRIGVIYEGEDGCRPILFCL